MGVWGSELFGKPTTLDAAVAQLNPKTKQAMYAAANKGLIYRKTWGGCAFNAGGKEIDQHIDEVSVATEVFELPIETVSRFIDIWDRLPGSDEETTEQLKSAILKAGLFTEAGETQKQCTLRKTIYKSQEDRMREEFERVVDGLDLSDDLNELVQSTKQAAGILAGV